MNAALRRFANPFNFSQISYATTDIDRAVEQCKTIYGIPQFSIIRDAEVQTVAGVARINSALAFADGKQIELIQPVGGADGVYRDALPTQGFALRHHHFGHLIRSEQDWQQVNAVIRAHGWATPLGGNYRDLIHYVYVDLRAELGHYLEFMYLTEEAMKSWDPAPENR